MKSNTLLRTNLLIGIIIVIGFTAVSFISYRSSFEIYQKDVEMVSTLSSEGLFNEISSIFSQPVNVSLTMANDSLLKNFLENEQENATDKQWQKSMREYLENYRNKYKYDSVFLVSASTNNYYHFQGLDRVLDRNNSENQWYYNLIKGREEYALNVDNDEATDNSVTVFVNCKIKRSDGSTLGVVGVGLKVHSLQNLLSKYEKKYGVQVHMVDADGIIQISSSVTGYEHTNLFDTAGYANNKNAILNNQDSIERFWYSANSGDRYVVSKYEPNLKWHLIVENDISAANKQFNNQLMQNIIIIMLIVVFVIIIISKVIKRYNVRISQLTISQELEYQRLLHEMTAGLYENIYELDITHNCAGSEDTKKYFKSLDISPDMPLDRALHAIAGKQIKQEYIQGYIKIFSPTAVMEAYKSGITNLSYDFMITDDGTNYHWMRISGRIFYWNSDQSVRLITYRENIDAEKKRELQLLEGVQRDPMTGLYNKRATEDLTKQALDLGETEPSQHHVFLIFDIDNFKTVNDNMGHSFGDHVINEIAATINTQFREDDIVGRIGGDEFAILMKNMDNPDGLNQKLARLCDRIESKDFGKGQSFHITCSIGVSLFPEHGSTYAQLYEKADQALYHAKNHGKNSFSVFGKFADSYSFHSNQRDMEALMDNAADGLAQYACTDPLTLLYFNQNCVELFGIPASVLSSPDFSTMDHVHPDDVEQLSSWVQTAAVERKPFTSSFRIRHQEGHYVPVQIKGIFINEMYKEQYPVFYVMYFRQDGK